MGDLQRGCEHATVEYGAADAPGVQVLYDELDETRGGRFVHRVLLWPEGELEVHFDTASVTRTTATPSDRR